MTFFVTLFSTILIVCGKVNFTNLSRYSELNEKTYRRQFTGRVWHVSLKREIRVVYLIDRRLPNRVRTCLLFSTDVEQDPKQIVQFYKLRFGIEFLFRDAKQFTGLSDCQARDLLKLDFHFNASFTALNLAKFDAHHQHQGQDPFVFSMASAKRRAFNQPLLERFMANLDLEPSVIKSHPNFSTLCDYGTIAA
ncbi:transposase [Phormidesmis priestleyi]|uniref:transposase n=1 Tax=Phormidesmis priestleyi TaxID=268141 RepID=UPI0009334C9B|nr:transposase [Phormidesmis priestleyi]